jgi:hypothetical protein
MQGSDPEARKTLKRAWQLPVGAAGMKGSARRQRNFSWLHGFLLGVTMQKKPLMGANRR